jgi:hypothetical protein
MRNSERALKAFHLCICYKQKQSICFKKFTCTLGTPPATAPLYITPVHGFVRNRNIKYGLHRAPFRAEKTLPRSRDKPHAWTQYPRSQKTQRTHHHHGRSDLAIERERQVHATHCAHRRV